MTDLDTVATGWPAVETSAAVVGIPATIAAPELTPSPLSLVGSIRVDDVAALPPDIAARAPRSAAGGVPQEPWAAGFTFLPEMIGPDDSAPLDLGYGDSSFPDPDGTPPFGLWIPFLTTRADKRSTIGFSLAGERIARLLRGHSAHEPWAVENQVWAGSADPTQPYLALPEPYYPVGVTSSAAALALGALEGAIAELDAGVGIIHCTTYVMQVWASKFAFRYTTTPNFPGGAARGLVWTPNGNLVVPGYGYPGTGPGSLTVASCTTAASSESVTVSSGGFPGVEVGMAVTGTGVAPETTVSAVSGDTLTLSAEATASGTVTLTFSVTGEGRYTAAQWAYATDMLYGLRGKVEVIPPDLAHLAEVGATDVTVDNAITFRAQRPWAVYGNQQLRAAVLVDTTT